MKKLQESLSKTLGIEYETESKNLPAIQTPSNVATYIDVVPVEDEEEAEDFQIARETLKAVMEKGDEAAELMLTIASDTEKARDFEVYATILKTMTDTTNSLYALHEKRKKMKETNERSVSDKSGGINVERAVFVGSPSELLKQMKEKQKAENG